MDLKEKVSSLNSLIKERTSITGLMKSLLAKRNSQTTGKSISTSLGELSEIGEAFLVDKEGKVIFKFIDGMLGRDGKSDTIPM